MLEKVGFTITCDDNGEQALAEALIQEFDIILLDIQMPVMDGVEAQSLIRSTGVTTPIIALTANAMSDEIKHYLSIGFDDHIAKPIDNKDFYGKLSKYIESPVIEVALPEQEFQIMRQQFVNNLTEQKELAEHLFCLGDNEQLKKLCHSLYGAAGMFGYADLGDKAKELEVAITNQSAKEINLVYQSFIREIKQAR